MKRIACIGSRDLDADQISTCEKLGAWVVQCGHILDTGNALGADQAFARGANTVCPDLVHLHLPWSKYERQAIQAGNVVHDLTHLDAAHLQLYTEIAAKHHPAYSHLSHGAKLLMTRNSSILLPPPMYLPVDWCLALPSDKKGGGGTGQGMRIAQSQGIKLVNLRDSLDQDLFELCEEIAQL